MKGSLYLPGSSWLHRLSAGSKLALLAVFGVCLMWLTHPAGLALCLLVLIFLVRQTGASLEYVWKQVRPVVWFLLILALYTSFLQSPAQALEMVLRLACLMLAGLLVTLTTPLTQMMSVVEWLLQPLERCGWVRADRVALAFGLTLRLIPELSLQWQEIREAQAARGIESSIFSLCVPMLLRTLRRADEIAEAIDARSIH